MSYTIYSLKAAKYLESLNIEKPVVALGRPVMYRSSGLKVCGLELRSSVF